MSPLQVMQMSVLWSKLVLIWVSILYSWKFWCPPGPNGEVALDVDLMSPVGEEKD
jgi:hypothetical protein